jgi:hypothetical protein
MGSEFLKTSTAVSFYPFLLFPSCDQGVFSLIIPCNAFTAGWKIDGNNQLLLRRSDRQTKVRRFLRPGGCAAIDWRDNPTTVKEEALKAAPIPATVSMEVRHELAVTNLPPNFSIRMEALLETTLRAVKKMGALKQEEEKTPVATVGPVRVFDFSNGYASSSLPRAVIRRNRRGAVPTIKFEPLPMAVGDSSSDDKTASKDTAVKDPGDKVDITVYEGWEMRM